MMKEASSEIRSSYDCNRDGSLDGKLRWRPICGCGESAVLRRATTVTNFGKQFWGCRHYKGSSESGCGYFQWFFDDVVDEKDQFIKKQNNRLEKLQNELDGAKMEIHHLKERKDGLKHKIMELQIEMKKMKNSQKKWKRFFFIMLVVVIWMML